MHAPGACQSLLRMQAACHATTEEPFSNLLEAVVIIIPSSHSISLRQCLQTVWQVPAPAVHCEPGWFILAVVLHGMCTVPVVTLHSHPVHGANLLEGFNLPESQL
jgi:hypothetical protein